MSSQLKILFLKKWLFPLVTNSVSQKTEAICNSFHFYSPSCPSCFAGWEESRL